jgi:hypothetical protein
VVSHQTEVALSEQQGIEYVGSGDLSVVGELPSDCLSP